MTEITVLHDSRTCNSKVEEAQKDVVVQEVCQLLTYHHLLLSGLL